MIPSSPDNIVIVDDTPQNLTVLTRILSSQGYLVRPAINGQLALTAIRKSPPDVILLDIMMPGMDGYEVCRQLKADAETRDIPIIFISALDEMSDKIKAFKLGGVDYITKPFQSEEVIARVHTHLQIRRMQKQLQIQNASLQAEIAEHARTEEDLRKLARAVEQSASIIVITDTSGRIEFANPAFFTTTGFTPEEVLGKTPSILQSGKHPQEFYRNLWETITRGDVWTGEFVNTRKDGELYWESASISPVKDQRGAITHYVAVKEDITDRKKAEDMLLQLQKAVETTEVGITITDAKGTIVYINPADAAMHGYRVEELSGRRSNIFAPIESRTHTEFLPHEADRFSNWTRERVNVRKDGSEFPVKLTSNPIHDKNGDLIGNVIVCEDITERKQAEETLAKERNLLRTLIDCSPEFIYVKDTESRFLLANEVVLKSFALASLDQLVGKTDFDFHPPDMAEEFYETERPVIEQGQSLINREEYIIDQQTGHARWLLSSKVPFRDSQGTILGLVGLNRDITELKRTEQILQKQAILLRGVAGVMNRLLVSDDLKTSLIESLEILGFATGVDRIYIYQTHTHSETGKPVMSQRFTWAQDLFEVVINDPTQQQRPYYPHLSRWYETLSQNQLLSGIVREFPSEERALLDAQHTLSTLIVPIFLQQHFWGFIGFDNCQNERQWNEEEESILLAMAGSIGGAIARQQAESNLIDANTHLQETLNHLQRTQHQLVLSEKMAALGQLIAGVAHEINTPLGAIRSSIATISTTIHETLRTLPAFFQSLSPEHQELFLALLDRSRQRNTTLSIKEERTIKRCLSKELQEHHLDNVRKMAELLVNIGVYDHITPFLPLLQDPEYAHILDIAYRLSGLEESTRTIGTATNRASKVVFALKSYAHYDQSGAMIEANIIEGIETVLTLYHNQMKQQIDLIRQYREIPVILCAPDELNQVWTNLIHNALQAMHYQGTLTICIYRENDAVVVAVTDTGQGIPADVHPHIFEPFFTTKPAGEGSGLGLDIVKKIIEKHQGEITFTSQPGSTTFFVRLPITRDA